jgi:hypothetical protein
MIEFRTEHPPKLALLLDGRAEITFTAPKSVLRAFEGLGDKPLTVTVKEYRPKRSLSQNSYLWVLLGELSAKLTIGKEDLYKQYIHDFGIYEVVPIRNDAVERWVSRWEKNGLGYFCEDLGESKLDGYTKIITYYGSSCYNSAEMARLIDAVIFDCNEQGINTMPLKDFMLLQNDND